ncbi:hypothetical protein HGRIS_006383 [Hohenbuehelia grisea]|uniref:DUF4246 domain-containing protein n=1 Tax=Hohenbuehelia grisea TaxID=104357 RepID=A0ABR3K2M6_9AGAR
MDATEILKFCDAIRAKDGWAHKVLDEKRGLAKKWATEAGLWIPSSDEAEKQTNTVLDLFHQLKAEARRILAVDHAITLRSNYRLPERSVAFDAISKDVANSVSYQRQSKFGLRDPDLKDIVGVFVSDGVIPPSLHAELVSELDALAALEPKDFHPGTEGKVQDLIHPSLYPFVAQETPVYEGVRTPPLVDGKFSTKVIHALDNSANPEPIFHKSKYAWIPSVFQVSDDGKSARVESYINGLAPREDFPDLYRIIEELFICALPHLERTTQCELERRDSPSVQRWWDRADYRGEEPELTKSEWEAMIAKQKAEKERQRTEKAQKIQEDTREMEAEWASRETRFPIAQEHRQTSSSGRSYKVIVKAANYVLRPGQSYQGTWHLEGMPHERIAASFIYYYSTDEAIQDDGLGMRRARDEKLDFPPFLDLNHEAFNVVLKKEGGDEEEEEEEEDEEDDPEHNFRDDPSSDAEDFDSSYVPLGTVPTTHVGCKIGHRTGRIISFPNWIQHKVLGIRNSETKGTEAAQRKILCFFLVDDTNAATDDEVELPGMKYSGLKDQVVLTTSDVPRQLRGTNVPSLFALLPWVSERLIGKRLPLEIVSHITKSTDLGLTREAAERHRRAFMEDRKIKVSEENKLWESAYSLCEH